ncbi:MAG: hypothetical protein ABUJ98_15675, partial [Hyphomicrobium sp.]
MIFVARTDEHKAILAAWAMERIPGCEGGFGDPFSALAIWRGDEMTAVVIYSGFRGSPERDFQCEIIMAADTPRWATPQTLHFILHYGLVNLGCRRMLAITKAKNRRVHKLLNGIGFVKEGYHRDMFEDGDA